MADQTKNTKEKKTKKYKYAGSRKIRLNEKRITELSALRHHLAPEGVLVRKRNVLDLLLRRIISGEFDDMKNPTNQKISEVFANQDLAKKATKHMHEIHRKDPNKLTFRNLNLFLNQIIKTEYEKYSQGTRTK